MKTYRLFILDPTSRFIVDVREVDAVDDQTALGQAVARLTDGPVEVWQGIRRVALLRPPGTATVVRPFPGAKESPAKEGRSVEISVPKRGKGFGTVVARTRGRA